MSQIEDKEQEVAKEGANNPDEKTLATSEENEQENGPSGPILLFFIIGFVVSIIIGWVLFPKLLYSQKKQPIDFNHALHNQEVGQDCGSCHFFREDGSFAGVPKIEQCALCHDEVLGESEDEAILVEEYIYKDKEIPWLIYSKQPDCVFFSHAAHVKMAKMDCKTCHGPIGESESLKTYEENRITGYSRDIWGKNISGIRKNEWDRMKMDDCAACHKEAANAKASTHERSPKLFFDLVAKVFPDAGKPQKTEACFVCHK
jgi:hypothetical protein